ncbi:MAG TPA: type II toxin-antitoxin system VapC family toxin [Candidatus Limnocylindria bacterium]|nr:type II toxin-antitoxin system VapC family toxin [Candidatus Limnocylindria bacterium]
MRLLLDTHVWLWMITGNSRIGDEHKSVLEEPANDLYLSAAAVWELAIKASAGKLKYTGNPSVQIPLHIQRSGVYPLDVTAEHALAAAALPMHHRDPFDRMLVAQAAIEEMTLATGDARLAAYGVPLLEI